MDMINEELYNTVQQSVITYTLTLNQFYFVPLTNCFTKSALILKLNE